MIIRIFFISLFIGGLLFAQDGQKSPNVELPEFVITGKEDIQLPIAAKPRPELISTVSDEYFKPLFSADQLQVREFSDPLKKQAIYLDTIQYLNFNLDAAIGFNSLPKASLKINLPLTNTLLAAGVKGEIVRAYLPNSDRYFLNGSLNFDHYFERNGDFLPGSNFFANADFGQELFKYFGSATPTLKRTLSTGDFRMGIKNIGAKNMPYSLEIKSEYAGLPSTDFSENTVKLKGFTSLSFSKFDLRGNIVYATQYLKNSSVLEKNINFINLSSGLNIKLSNTVKVFFGLEYAKSDSNILFSPTGAIAVKLDRGLLLFAEYKPQVDFLTNKSLLEENRYFEPLNFENIFFKKSSKFSLTIKYEYEKYFEIETGFGYFSSLNYPFYSDTINAGRFNISMTEARNAHGFVNLLFHPGPFGYFYSEGNFQFIRDAFENQLPYYPLLKGFLSYGYTFPYKITVETKLFYRTKIYTDLADTTELNSAFDLGIKLYYPLFDQLNITFEAVNIFNQKTYSWKNYQDPSVNVLAGINYKW